MPAPTNSPFLTLGPVVLDREPTLAPGVDPSVAAAIQQIYQRVQAVCSALGYVSPAQTATDDEYQLVVYKPADGGFYGTVPEDPLNPDLLLASAGGTIIVQEEGVSLTARGIINFIGASVTAADDAGNTRTNVTIVGGSSNSFETIVCDAGTSPVADSATDSVTFIGGEGVTTTGNSGADSVTWDVDIASSKGLEFLSNQLAVKPGLYIDVDASGVNVDLTEVSGYSGAATQLLGHVAGTIQFKTIAEWLNLLAGYTSGNDQSIGHDASGSTEWQDDDEC